MAENSKSDIEVHFISVALDKGIGLPKSTRHILSVNLVCPRPTVAQKSSSRTVELSNGSCEPPSPAWTDSIALKESVSGRFGIEVTVSEAVPDEMADYLTRTAAGALVKVFAVQFGAAFSGLNLDDIAEITPATLAKALPRDRAPATLARGVFDFDSGARFPKRTVVEIPLLAVANVRRAVVRGAKGATPVSRKKVFSKGERIGLCRLGLETV